jgi:two-component system response regulator CpxR
MKRVLIVDDDESVLKLVETVLRHSGYEVVQASDGQQALDLLDASIDVLLCDKNLPLVPGTQVVLEARARFPKLTTVLMTAAPEALALTTLGLDGYLAKPFRSNSLVVHTLQAALDRHALKEKRQELETQLQSAVAQLSRRDR